MTLLSALEKVINVSHEIEDTREDCDVARFLRDHGPALLETLVDAERYQWLRDKSNPNVCAFYLSVGMALHGVKFTKETVDQFIDHSRTKLNEEGKEQS